MKLSINREEILAKYYKNRDIQYYISKSYEIFYK